MLKQKPEAAAVVYEPDTLNPKPYTLYPIPYTPKPPSVHVGSGHNRRPSSPLSLPVPRPSHRRAVVPYIVRGYESGGGYGCESGGGYESRYAIKINRDLLSVSMLQVSISMLQDSDMLCQHRDLLS
jgi:hypothetical protein